MEDRRGARSITEPSEEILEISLESSEERRVRSWVLGLENVGLRSLRECDQVEPSVVRNPRPQRCSILEIV